MEVGTGYAQDQRGRFGREDILRELFLHRTQRCGELRL